MSLTAGQAVEVAQNNLNAVSDTLWSSAELLKSLYLCELELALKTGCIQTNSTAVSVASTAEYTAPTGLIDIWRMTYDGNKLQKITRREWDSINYNSTTAVSGTPRWYTQEAQTFTLFPTPNTSALTIKYYYSIEPTEATSTSSSLTTPSRYHYGLTDMLTARMCPKDTGHPLTLFWTTKATEFVNVVTAQERFRRRGDRFAKVNSEQSSLATDFGIS